MMNDYDYKTIAAPRRVKRIKGVKGKDAQLSQAIEDLIRDEARSGWEYLRADTFQIEEGGGLFGKMREVSRTLLIFRKRLRAEPRTVAAAEPQPQVAAQVSAAPPPPVSPPPLETQAPPPPVTATRAEPKEEPRPLGKVSNERGFSIAGVEPPKRAPKVGGATDD